MILDRFHAGEEGTKRTVRGLQGIHHLKSIARPQRSFPTFQHSRQGRWVMNLQPAPVFHFFESGSGVVVPATVVPETVSSLIRHPGQMWNGLGQCSKLPLALLYALARLHHIGNVDYVDEDSVNLTRQIAGCGVHEINIQILQERRRHGLNAAATHGP